MARLRTPHNNSGGLPTLSSSGRLELCKSARQLIAFILLCSLCCCWRSCSLYRTHESKVKRHFLRPTRSSFRNRTLHTSSHSLFTFCSTTCSKLPTSLVARQSESGYAGSCYR